MPRVRIVTTEVTPFEINTNATTWGELKGELSDSLPNLSGMTVVLSTNKSTLDLDEAALPSEENYKLYISPKAIKQGYWVREEEYDNDEEDSQSEGQVGIEGLIQIMQEEFVQAFENIKSRAAGLEVSSQEDLEDLEMLKKIRQANF